MEQIGWGPQSLLVCRHRFLAEKTSSTERKKPEYSDKIILWTYLSKRPQEGRLIQANYSPSSFSQVYIYTNCYRKLTWKLMYHGFCPRADVPTGRAFRYIDLQITVRWVEPPGPLFLLFLQHKLKGAVESQLMVLWWHSWHCGRNLHVILGARLLTDNGVPVGVACSVTLESHKKRKHYSQQLSFISGDVFRSLLVYSLITEDWFEHLKEKPKIIPSCWILAQCAVDLDSSVFERF